MHDMSTILWISVALQVGAALLALRLIKVSGRAAAWIILSTAFMLMTARRAVSLLAEQGLVSAQWPAVATAEVIALVISVLICIGVYLIGDIFVQQRQSESARRKLARAVEQSPVGTVITDAGGIVEYVNPCFATMSGLDVRALIGKPLAAICHAENSEAIFEQIWRTVQQQGAWKGELANRSADGTLRWDATQISPVRNDANVITHHVVTLQDITEAKETRSRLEQLALHDSLTGLPNRTLFADRVRQTIFDAQRHHRSFALMILDLDRFKEINDTLGHPVGDDILRELGPRLSSLLRKTDTVARMGGDEFLLLLPDADRARSQQVATKIAEVMTQPFAVAGYNLRVGASIGIATFPEHGMSADALTRSADIAMYAAKRGNLGYAFYDAEFDDNTLRRLAITHDLGHAVSNHELVLYLHPKVCLQTNRTEGFEALLRWKHNGKDELLMPDVFIPLAEQNGMIKALTQWVLTEAARAAAALANRGDQLSIAVNISMQDFLDQGFPDMVQRILQSTNANPAMLILELTESTLMTDVAKATATLARLSALGVRVSIDDFGTGYSSLEYLSSLPVYELKIDRSFVRDMIVSKGNDAIVRSTIDLAHNLGMRVVAEGVETDVVRTRLRELGCDAAQGFYFSHPFEAANAAEYLRRDVAP